MKPASRSKRTAETSPGTSKSPDPKRPTLGDTTRSIEDRRKDQQRRLQEFKENRKVKAMERKKEVAARPAWKPAGSHKSKRPVTRSMTRFHSASNIHSAIVELEPEIENNSSLPLPKMESSKNTSVISETVASIAEVERVTITSTPLVENPAMTSLTPVAKRLQLIDIEHENHHDEFNLIHWQAVYDDHLFKLINCQNQLNGLGATEDEFWQVERDRAVGEVGFFLGNKSKFTQFSQIIKNPKGEKFKVQSEDDIACYWDGMVLPSVIDFLARSKWLVSSSAGGWSDSDKALKPDPKIGKSPSRPREEKENRRPKLSSNDPVVDKDNQEKKLKVKKEAEDRRKKMRAMMAAKKRAMSTSDLPNDAMQ